MVVWQGRTSFSPLNESHVGMKYHIKSSALELTIATFREGKAGTISRFSSPTCVHSFKNQTGQPVEAEKPETGDLTGLLSALDIPATKPEKPG
jgi:hypothetical protein